MLSDPPRIVILLVWGAHGIVRRGETADMPYRGHNSRIWRLRSRSGAPRRKYTHRFLVCSGVEAHWEDRNFLLAHTAKQSLVLNPISTVYSEASVEFSPASNVELSTR